MVKGNPARLRVHNQDRPTLVRNSEGLPADLAALHATFSQPSASQAREFSSLENSDAVGGCAR